MLESGGHLLVKRQGAGVVEGTLLLRSRGAGARRRTLSSPEDRGLGGDQSLPSAPPILTLGGGAGGVSAGAWGPPVPLEGSPQPGCCRPSRAAAPGAERSG